jgi:hypothetical protein
MANTYDDLVLEPEQVVGGALTRRFLDGVPEVVRALRATGVTLVMIPRRDDLPQGLSMDERARSELGRAEEFAMRSEVAWPLYVGTGYVTELSRQLHVDEAGEHCGPPIRARPSRGALLGYVMVGEGGAIFYTPSGRLAFTQQVRDLAIELVSRVGDPEQP